MRGAVASDSVRNVIVLFAVSVIAQFCELIINQKKVMPMMESLFLAFLIVVQSVGAIMIANLLLSLKYLI